jgi:type II secretory pathway component PulC
MKAFEFREYIQSNLNKPTIAVGVAALLLLAALWTLWGNLNTLWLDKNSASEQAFRPSAQITLSQLPSLHLMGSYSTSLHDLPLASLGVTLLGIFSNTNGQSTALIALSGANSDLYHVGDKLSANVMIEKIMPKSLIVKHNGRLEKLEMAIQPVKFDNNVPQKRLFKD